MSDSNETADDEDFVLPKGFRLKPSGNHKRRSKLAQAPNESPVPIEPAAEEVSLPPPAASAPDHGVRKYRLKRSGHMHEDLTAPIPEDDKSRKREAEY